jgi:hypothetical protein
MAGADAAAVAGGDSSMYRKAVAAEAYESGAGAGAGGGGECRVCGWSIRFADASSFHSRYGSSRHAHCCCKARILTMPSATHRDAVANHDRPVHPLLLQSLTMHSATHRDAVANHDRPQVCSTRPASKAYEDLQQGYQEAAESV